MTRRTDFKPPKVLDFRRDDRRELLTLITVHADYKGHAWIHTGDVDIVKHSGSGQRGSWTLDAKNYGATDFDHDMAILFRIKLTGVAFSLASGGRLWIDAFIAGDDPDAFRVPLPGWNQLKGATKCTHGDCRTKDARHLVVDEGRYIPPPNPELFDMLRGLRIEIVTGVNNDH